MKKLIIFIGLTIIFSCSESNKEVIPIKKPIQKVKESKRDCLNRMFIEESKKGNYYSSKFIKALKNNNLELMKTYRDSSKMTSYTIAKIYKNMYPKSTLKDTQAK